MASTFFKDARCQVGLKLTLWFWKRVFSKVVHVFSHVFFVSPLKRDIMRFYLHKLEFHSRVISAKFSWNWPEGSGYKFSMNVYLFCQEKNRMWTNLKIFQFSMLCAKFGWKSSCDSGNKIPKFYILYYYYFVITFRFKRMYISSKKIQNVINVFSLCRYLLSLEKGVWTIWSKFESHLPMDALVEIGTVILKKTTKM